MQVERDTSGSPSRLPARGERVPQGYPAGPQPPSAPRFTLDRVVRFVLGVGLIVLMVWLLWYFSTLVVYLLVGVLLAYLLRPIVDRIQGVGIGRIPAILVTLVAVFGSISVLLTYLIPFVATQVSDMSRQISFETTVHVAQVEPGGPAYQAGIRQGDRILAVEGIVLQRLGQLQSFVDEHTAGASVELTVQTGDEQRRTVPVILAAAESDDAAVTPDQARQRISELGLTVEPIVASGVITAIEDRVREIVPFVEEGDLMRMTTNAFSTLFQEDRLTQMATSVVGLFTDIFYAVLVIPFIMFFVLKDGKSIRRGLLRLVPNRYFEVTLAVVEKIETNLGRYFRGLLLQCVSIATVATVLLYIVGLNYALAVGIFTGLANTIPYFGPLMGFLAGTLVGIAQTGDFSLVLGVFIAMGLTQIMDNMLFHPLIFSRAARSHPLVILFVVLVGAQVGGIVGMLVAIPVTTIVRVAIEQVLWSLRNYRILKAA